MGILSTSYVNSGIQKLARSARMNEQKSSSTRFCSVSVAAFRLEDNVEIHPDAAHDAP